MVVDTSAIVAILLGEPEADALRDALAAAPAPMISAVSLFEARMVMMARKGPAGREAVDAVVEGLDVEVVAFDLVQAGFAADAFSRFDKGVHPAALNFGDCCAYALARSAVASLLYKGGDFSRTDVVSALS